MSKLLLEGALVLQGSRDNPLGSTMLVGTRRYRVVREVTECGQHAVIARPCKWYDLLDVAAGRLARLARRASGPRDVLPSRGLRLAGNRR